MSIFEPQTYSVDWESAVVDKLDRCVDSERLTGFAGMLHKEFDLPIQTDWNAIEFALGVNSSFAQLWDRVQQVTDRASQVFREYDLDIFPLGSHPTEPMFFGAHVHVGTIHDESAAIHLANCVTRYLPAFAALAANSPASHERKGEFKSYRVRHSARWASTPTFPRDPEVTQETWGTDVLPKLYGAPTIEIRVMDSASSRRLLAEMATFVAAFVHHVGTRMEKRNVTKDEYREYLNNRWTAARYGLQATFAWDGKPRPVTEILDEMLDSCAAELQALGVDRSDFGMIDAMLRKRVCQADYLRDLVERYPDPFQLASVCGKLLRQWDIFDEYLDTAPALEPCPALDNETILAEHLDWVGDGTHFYHLRYPMWYSPSLSDELIAQMVERGLISREVTPNRGTLLHRTDR
ncbi:MAG: glutamate-cysteine ligase family protein [Armatimonadota bacterium]|nr:glutamate-cysteine ligase family protein [Armatimonadota bacterium]